MKQHLSKIVLYLAFPTVVLAAETPKTTQPERPRIAATINGEVLTVQRLDELYARMSPEMRANYDRAGGKKAFVDNYIGKRLVLQEALKTGLDKKPDVQQDILSARETVLFNRYIKDVVAPSIISDHDVRAWYETHKDQFQKGERIRARHIIATPDDNPVMNSTGDNARSKEEALAKLTRIAQQVNTKTASFQAMATQYSEDASAANGGDLGWFTRGMMTPAFEEAAFSLPKGKVSHIVETPFGYHLILVEEREEAAPAKFEEVSGDIRERLLAEKADKILAEVNKLTQELRAQSQVQVFAENLE